MDPGCAHILRPYASHELLAIPLIAADGSELLFTIDPGTQRWLILRPPALHLLAAANGKRTLATLAVELVANPAEGFATQEDVWQLAEELLHYGLLFDNQAAHKLAAQPIYNACEPTGLHIEITNACNMTCTHCYVASGTRLPNEMTMAEIYRVVDELPAFSGKQIAISGGEPIVRKGCMDLVEYCAAACGHHVDLYTNGRKFPRNFGERIVAINAGGTGRVRVQVSLEGAIAATNDLVRGPGSFADALATLAMFRDIGLARDVVIFVCLTKANIAEVDDLIRLAECFDVGMLVFSQWQRQGNARDIPWASIAPTTEQWVATGARLLDYSNPRLQVFGNFYGDLRNTDAGRLRLDAPLFPKHVYFYNAFPRVTPQGDIFADQLWVDRDWILGNVKRGDRLDSVFAAPKFAGQLQAMRDRVAATPDCARCHWRDLCGGGSAGHTYAEYGHMQVKDLFCESRIWWFERYVSHQAEHCLGSGVQVRFAQASWVRLSGRDHASPNAVRPSTQGSAVGV